MSACELLAEGFFPSYPSCQELLETAHCIEGVGWGQGGEEPAAPAASHTDVNMIIGCYNVFMEQLVQWRGGGMGRL